MSDSKTYVIGNDAQNSFDPNFLLGAMMNGGGGFGGWGGGANWILPFFLFALWGGNGFGGWGGGANGANGFGYLANQLNNDTGRELILSAIQNNSAAINQLATTLNCSVGDIQQAINSLSTQICNLGNQVGMTGMQVINAIQAGNSSLASQLAQCCCDTKSAIKDVAIGQERGFSSIAYETQRQTCDIEKAIANSTAQILEGQRAAEMREMQNKIDALQDANQTYKLGNMMAQSNAPIVNAINSLQNDVDKIKCKLPNTITVPFSEAQAVPNCIAYQYGLYGGYPFGNGSFWG